MIFSSHQTTIDRTLDFPRLQAKQEASRRRAPDSDVVDQEGHNKGTHHDHDILEKVVDGPLYHKVPNLVEIYCTGLGYEFTTRERDVLRLLERGPSNADISGLVY